MKNDTRHTQKQDLKALSTYLFQELKADEQMTLSYSGEETLFIRVSQAKVKQASEVSQAYLTMSLISHHRRTEIAFSLKGEQEENLKYALQMLQQCRQNCETLPEDPYLVLPEAGASSEEDFKGKLPEVEKLAETLLKPAKSIDLAGLFASGLLMRASMNSKGQFHWFSTENFYFDYSLYTSAQKAIKAIYAGNTWQESAYISNLNQAKNQLALFDRASRKLLPGKYRVYFAPAAVAEFVKILSWSGISGGAIMQDRSAFKRLYEGQAHLSPLLSVDEDFTQGFVPRFNEFGDVSALKIPLITNGKLTSPLINRRTAQEYGLQSNAANGGESLRSPYIHPGSLQEDHILQNLGTGLYISNLHYLNWSDLQQGRITGMTRYGCFWVENGEIVSPIDDMRFDETLYHFWGKALEALSERAELIPDVCSYGERTLGGVSVPGMMVNDFSFTL